MFKPTLLAVALTGAVMMTSPFAYAADDADLQALRAELKAMQHTYEAKIKSLEGRIADMEQDKAAAVKSARTESPAATSAPATASRSVGDNSFNPSIGVILNGRYSAYSETESEIAGFAVGHEGERPDEGLGIEETEMNFSASVGDKFSAKATVALHEHEGETEVEIEEAYFQTTGLPAGIGVKAGRFFAPVGYLNEQHTHTDDFSDRPLPRELLHWEYWLKYL